MNKNMKRQDAMADIAGGDISIPKKLAVINDLSGYGRCSLCVSIPVISALGVQCCPVPTAVLSNHTGFPSEYKFDMTRQMRPYIEAWSQLDIGFDGIITAYMNYEEQVKIAADFIDRFRQKDTMVFVDPAMADHGRLYRGFTDDYAGYIRDRLIRQATVIKPNITEACLLTGFDYDRVKLYAAEPKLKRLKAYIHDMVGELRELGPDKIVITGIERNDRIINVVADGSSVSFISGRRSGHSRGGTGDIFSSIVAASLLQGMSLERAVRKAADFVSMAIRISDEAGVPVNEGVIFENILSKLASTSFEHCK
ncbi:MAG TPA: pyridoxamine kinase [Candidatus Avilachnospira avistercoris]|nr:pyridoxamine kinase [Candidatus Avilachnospira avistercoris]